MAVIFCLCVFVAAIFYLMPSVSDIEKRKEQALKILKKELTEWIEQADIYFEAEDWDGYHNAIGKVQAILSKIDHLKKTQHAPDNHTI